MESKPKQRSQLWLGILISVACLAAIFFFIEPAEIWLALQSARFDYLGLTAVGILFFLIFRAIRWRFMLDNDIPLRTGFHIQNIGYMVNMLLPFRLGDLAQAILIGSVPPVTTARGLSTVVTARVIDMMIIVSLLPFTLAAVPTLPPQVQSAALATGLVTLVAILILIGAANQRPFARKVTTAVLQKISHASQRAADRITAPNVLKRLFGAIGRLNITAWVRRFDDLLAGLGSLTSLKSGLTLLLMSILVWLPIIFAYRLGMLAVGLDVSWAMAAFVVCAAALSVAAPSSPGQVGVFHAGVIFALVTVLGQPQGPSASFAFLYHAINLIIMVGMGVLGLLATGATFRRVIDTTRQFTQRPKQMDPS